MLVREKKNFIRGLVMLLTFAALFVCLLFPIMRDEQGRHLTGLQYADNVFNELSKGSSNFFPQVRDQIKGFAGKEISVSVQVKKSELIKPAIEVLTKAGAQAREENGRLIFSGDMALILGNATEMSEYLYNNDKNAVEKMYPGIPALTAARAWWYALTPTVKALQKQDKVGEAKAVDQVIRRAIEPGNNFFTLPPAKVKDHVVLLAAMLGFYVLYTLWYGFSIFELFEGIGLAMTKSKTKTES